jgi:hypothetical protein
VLGNLWLGSEEGEAIAAALGPKLQKTKGAVEQLLFEVATLEVRQLGRIPYVPSFKHETPSVCAQML